MISQFGAQYDIILENLHFKLNWCIAFCVDECPTLSIFSVLLLSYFFIRVCWTACLPGNSIWGIQLWDSREFVTSERSGKCANIITETSLTNFLL